MRKKVGIIKRVLCIGLIFLLSINSFAAIVSDNDGSAFITKAEFDALKSSFQSQIDSYNQSIDSKIDGAIASYLAGIKLSTVMGLNNLYEQKGGTTLKWANLNDLKSNIETNVTLAGGLVITGVFSSLNVTSTGRGQYWGYFGSVKYGTGADDAYPYWSSSVGGWPGSRTMPKVNPGWTGTWPSMFELDGSIKSGTTEYRLSGWYSYAKRVLVFGDLAWGNRYGKSDTTYMKSPYKNLDPNGEELGWFYWWNLTTDKQESDVYPSYTIIAYDDIKRYDLSNVYQTGKLSWTDQKSGFINDRMVWINGDVPWINPTKIIAQWFIGTTDKSADMDMYDRVFKQAPPNYPERINKKLSAGSIMQGKENKNTPIYAGSLLTSGAVKGTVEFDIEFDRGTLDSSNPETNISYISLSFNTDKYTNDNTNTGDIKILSCTTSGYNKENVYSLNDLNISKVYHVKLQIENGKDIWMRIQGLDSSKNLYTSFGPYVTADVGDIKLIKEN